MAPQSGGSEEISEWEKIALLGHRLMARKPDLSSNHGASLFLAIYSLFGRRKYPDSAIREFGPRSLKLRRNLSSGAAIRAKNCEYSLYFPDIREFQPRQDVG